MPKDSLKKLLDEFPDFMNKNEDSNFYKSQDVTNRQFQDLYQSLFNISESFNLDKNCLIWKTQTVAYDYSINFVASYPNLKSVSCFKNNELIYSEEYLYEDDVGSFQYIHEDSSENVIPVDTFEIRVETYNEYHVEKGFPENDEKMGDIYDHDYSLDIFGRLNNIPRKEYILVDEVYYPFTEPPYNNRLTEDDYHYLQRILYYNLHLWDTPRPILEIWKKFGVTATMENREKYLIRMIDMNKHPEAIIYDEKGVAVDFDSKGWVPQAWQHKGKDGYSSDLMCGAVQEEVFFFVDCNNQQPLLNQKIIFSFNFLNQFAEPVDGEYYILPFLNDTEASLNPITDRKWQINSNDIDPSEINTFYFEVYGDPGCENLLFTSDEILVQIRGCNTGDWYVDSTNGDDDNNGSINAPFQTIGKAVNSVYADKNLIVLLSQEYTISAPITISKDSQIISCNDSVIETTDENGTVFLINPTISLSLKNISLSCDDVTMYSADNTFLNQNSNNKTLRIGVNPRYSPGPAVDTVTLTCNKQSCTVGEHLSLSATVVDENGDGMSGVTVTFRNGASILGTSTTNSSGVATLDYATESAGVMSITAVAKSVTSTAVSVTVNKLTSSITIATSKASASIGETFTISGVLTSSSTGLVGKTVKLYDGNALVDTLNTGSGGAYSKTITASTSNVGSHSYTVVYEGDSTHTNVTSTAVSVTVTKKQTALTLATDKASVDVGEQFTLSGTLTSGAAGLHNVYVKIYDGNDLMWVVATDDGDFSKNITFDNQGLGTHTYHVEYEGDSTYASATSSNVSVVCGVTPAPTTVTITSDKSTVTTGGTVTFTATVLDQNDDPLSGETVTFKRGPTVLGTDTTDASGEATYQETISLSPGSYSFSAYASNGVYGMIIITVVAPVPASVSLTGDKSILSYADSDSCTLTATVLDSNSQPVSGETVSFDIVGGSNIDSATTGADGTCSVSYYSEGTGDLNIQASCGTLLSEIYEVEDCIQYYTSFKNFPYTSSGSNKIYTSSNAFPDHSKVYMKFSTFSSNFQVGVGSTSSNKLVFQQSPSYAVAYLYHNNTYSEITTKMSSTDELVFEIDGNTGKLYYNSVLIKTVTIAGSWVNALKFMIYGSNDYDMEYIKVKPL